MTILRESFSFNLANKILTLVKSQQVGTARVGSAKRPAKDLVNCLDLFGYFLVKQKVTIRKTWIL
jgi:hypothetical protein